MSVERAEFVRARVHAHARGLGGEPRIGIGKFRQQEQRPGERVRGGLVAGADEGDEIVVDHRIGERRAGLGVARRDQPRHQVVGHRLARRAARAPPVEQPRDLVAKHLLRRACADEGRTRQPARQRQHVPQVDPPERIEIGGDRRAHHLRRGLDLVAEHGARDDVVGQRGHLARGVDRRAGARMILPALEHRVDRDRHGGEIGSNRRRLEQRRDGAALQPPVGALGGEQAAPDRRRELFELQRVLRVVRRIVDQHMADHVRIVQQHEPAELVAVGDIGLLERVGAPRRDRVAAQRAVEAQRSERAGARQRRRRTPTGPARLCRRHPRTPAACFLLYEATGVSVFRQIKAR